MRKTRRIAAFLTAAVMAVSTLSVTASAADCQSQPYKTYVTGDVADKVVATVYQKRAGASGYYYVPLAYVHFKADKNIFSNVKVWGGMNTTTGRAYTSVQRGERILAVSNDAFSYDGTVWSDSADIGRAGVYEVTLIGYLFL